MRIDRLNLERPVVRSNYFPVHAHGEYSKLDGMGTVPAMAAKVAKNGQPALALTDHGLMSGVIRLYLECKKYDLTPFPGSELYVVSDVYDEEARKQRWHMGMVALTQKGFEAMIALSSRSHRRDRFHMKPLVDFSDLSELHTSGASKHVAVTTGCHFGIVVQTIINKGEAKALAVTRMLAKWFPHLFIEIQNHRIKRDPPWTEDAINEALLRIADKLGLPVVVGQDSHYCEASHKAAHDMMKDISYFGNEEDDNRFPGDSFHLGTTSWISRHFTLEQWERAEEGHAYLLGLSKLKLPELDTYKFHVPQMAKDPQARLKKLVKLGLHKKGADTYHHYIKRMEYELSVIHKMGFENYFILMYELMDFARRKAIFTNVRGSANGCLVAYLLGITQVDPIEWDLPFERFLSLDRMKPPDIDVDVESSGRDILIAYARKLFPSLTQIGTYGRLGITEVEDPDDPDAKNKGSVFVKYMAAKRRKVENFNGKVAPQDIEPLNQLADLEVRQNHGAHAAGFVFPGHDLPIAKYLPTMLIPSSGLTVTQPPMDDVEDAGYVKGDFLGLRSLETMRLVMEYTGHDPVLEGMAWIPNDDPKALKILSSGIPKNGIFQFEGWSTAKGVRKDMKRVQSTLDAILALALFRPALMTGGQTDRFLKNRRLNKTEKIHPIVDRHLDMTFGVPIFQEQVMDIMKSVGLSFEDRNAILKAVKASNDKIHNAGEVFKRIEPKFITVAVQSGLTAAQAKAAWAHVKGFKEYGFNKAHATGYGLLSYRMAYMKAHHPTEFMTALLATWVGRDKETQYVAEARRMGLSIGRPHVNKSGAIWTQDGVGTIRKGLAAIKGIGLSTAIMIVEEREANGRYASIDDFLERLPAKPVTRGTQFVKTGDPTDLVGVARDLYLAGAFGGL